MSIELIKRATAPLLTAQLVQKTYTATSKYVKYPKDFAISLIALTPAQMKQYNTKYRAVPEVTDVLSFPYGGGKGDIFICYAQAVKQAKAKQNPINAELAWLTVHGILHVLGYDHETAADAKVMRPLEQLILAYV